MSKSCNKKLSSLQVAQFFFKSRPLLSVKRPSDLHVLSIYRDLPKSNGYMDEWTYFQPLTTNKTIS